MRENHPCGQPAASTGDVDAAQDGHQVVRFDAPVEPRRLGLVELVFHPLALRSASGSVTRAFNPASPQHDAAFLELLGLGCELTLKFIEQYYRWPVLTAHPSRLHILRARRRGIR